MGIYSEGIYKIRILPQTFLQYFIPFKTRYIHGRITTKEKATNLIDKGYKILIFESHWSTHDFYKYWIPKELNDLEHKVYEIEGI